jgi:hypothetical protein
MLTPSAPFAFPLCEDTFSCKDTVTYDESTTYEDTPPPHNPAALCISQEDAFTTQCDALIQSLTSFWPSQLASHFHLLDLDEALITAVPPDSDPRLAFTESAYTVKLSKFPGQVRGCVEEFSEAIKRIGYVGVDEGIELTPWQRYMLWKASCCSNGSGEEVEVRYSDCVRGWRYDYAQACALLHEIKVCLSFFHSPRLATDQRIHVGYCTNVQRPLLPITLHILDWRPRVLPSKRPSAVGRPARGQNCVSDVLRNGSLRAPGEGCERLSVQRGPRDGEVQDGLGWGV